MILVSCSALDRDHDGYLSREEFVSALTTQGDQPMAAEQANALFDGALQSASRRGPRPGTATAAAGAADVRESLELREFIQLMARLYFA